jgi:hypothetical protein
MRRVDSYERASEAQKAMVASTADFIFVERVEQFTVTPDHSLELTSRMRLKCVVSHLTHVVFGLHKKASIQTPDEVWFDVRCAERIVDAAVIDDEPDRKTMLLTIAPPLHKDEVVEITLEWRWPEWWKPLAPEGKDAAGVRLDQPAEALEVHVRTPRAGGAERPLLKTFVPGLGHIDAMNESADWYEWIWHVEKAAPREYRFEITGMSATPNQLPSESGKVTALTAPLSSKKGHLLLLAFLSVLFLGVLAVAVIKGPSLTHGLAGSLTVLVVATFAAIIALVFSALLGATGVLRTRFYTLTGGGAMFVIVCGVLFNAINKLPSDLPAKAADAVIIGQVSDLPPGSKNAHVTITGCAGDGFVKSDGSFTIAGCDMPSAGEYLFHVNVEGFRSEPLARPKGQPVYDLPFRGQPEVGFEITGYILGADNKPAAGARVYVEREGCKDFSAETEATGQFILKHLPPNCLVVPHPLTVTVATQAPETFDPGSLSSNIRHTLSAKPSAAPPPPPPPPMTTKIDRKLATPKQEEALRCSRREGGHLPGPCAVYCGKGLNNVVKQGSIAGVTSEPACAKEAWKFCQSMGSRTICTYKYLPPL